MHILMNRYFHRIYKKADIPKNKFDDAVYEIIQGNCTSLGHKLFKKRVGSETQGKRGSYRTISYYRKGEIIIFMYLFPKNDQGNISPSQKKQLVLLSRDYDALDNESIGKLIKQKLIIKDDYEKPKEKK